MKVLGQDQRLHSNNRWSEAHHFRVNGSDWQFEPQLAVAAVESRHVVGMVQSWTSSQQKWTELMVFDAHVEPAEHVTGKASVCQLASSLGKGDWRRTDIRINVATRLGSLSVEEDTGDNQRIRRSRGSR